MGASSYRILHAGRIAYRQVFTEEAVSLKNWRLYCPNRTLEDHPSEHPVDSMGPVLFTFILLDNHGSHVPLSAFDWQVRPGWDSPWVLIGGQEF